MGTTTAAHGGHCTLDDLRNPMRRAYGDRFPQMWTRLVQQAQIGGAENEAAAVRRMIVAALSDADPFIATLGRLMSARVSLRRGWAAAA